jgi:hypothetical protein
MENTVKSKSIYANLSAINVRGKVERKGQMDYLSWANAWHMLKQNYPEATRNVYEDLATGWNYFTDGRSAWVKVGIMVNGMEHIDYLPVMDFRNKALPVDKVTAIDVNKTIQRSTAKAIAMHGLGLSLWTREDITESDEAVIQAQEKAKATSVQNKKAPKLNLKKGDDNWDNVMSYVKDNKSLGNEKLTAMVGRKYVLSIPVKTELSNILNS